MAKKLRTSCCIVTIASPIGWNVRVVFNGREVTPSHDASFKTMQNIIPHYLALGIDRFAYMGHGCLKAALTTATLVGGRHCLTMYAVVTISKGAPRRQPVLN